MRDVLRKWTPREKYVKYQNFPTHFGLLLSLKCSGEVSRKSVESAYPINSLKVDVFLLKSYARFSLVKVSNQLAPHLEIIESFSTNDEFDYEHEIWKKVLKSIRKVSNLVRRTRSATSLK